MIKLLIVDDSALMRRLLGDLFKAQADFEVAIVRDGIEALERLLEFAPDVVTLDLNMPRMDGLTCLDRIMVLRPCPVVVVSSLTEAGATATLEAMQLGAVDFVAKPGGAVSLGMSEWAPHLVQTVRAASKARTNRALRLTERLQGRNRAGSSAPRQIAKAPRPATRANCTVLVGSSTGGPPALDSLLSRLDANFPWPVVVAQHMPASFTGPLARRLDKLCALDVVEVSRQIPLAPGRVYIARGDADIVVSSRSEGFVVTPAPASSQYRWHPSVDRLVASAMRHLGAPHLIGILMTGMGNDGATAMTTLRAEGGRTIAEAESTAVVWGMPGELVKAGGAEVVAPLHDIADYLTGWAQ